MNKLPFYDAMIYDDLARFNLFLENRHTQLKSLHLRSLEESTHLNLPIEDIDPEALIFEGSKNALQNALFGDLSPINKSISFDAYCNQNLLKIIGAGQGRAVAVAKDPLPMTEDFHSTLIFRYSSSILDIAVNSMNLSKRPPLLVNAMNFNDLVYKEVRYYDDLVAELCSKIETLENQVQDLNNKNYINAQLTWR